MAHDANERAPFDEETSRSPRRIPTVIGALALVTALLASGLTSPSYASAADRPPPAAPSAQPSSSPPVAPSASSADSATPPPPPSADSAQAARKAGALERFNAGVELMKVEKWDAALAEFVAGLDSYPTKGLRLTAAECLEYLDRFDEALAMWELRLKEFGARMTPQEVEENNVAILRLRGKVGALAIEANVEDATVVVDGRERGKTPLVGPIAVLPGTRVVRVVREGYAPFEARPVIAAKSTARVNAALVALARVGQVRVTEESGKIVDIVVDGIVVGKTPNETVLPPGAHAIALRGEGQLGTQPATVVVEESQTVVLRLRAEILEAEARIEPEPPLATLALDGVPLGRGAWEGRLRAGAHRLDVSADAYFGATKTFEATAARKERIRVVLERDERSPMWSKRRYRFSAALVGGGAIGPSFGGDYEGSCGSGCRAHTRPIGVFAGLRGGYEVVPGTSVEISLGYLATKMKVSRAPELQAERDKVPVDITDDFRMHGPFASIGAAYDLVRGGVIVTGAVHVGAILARARDTRTGTATTDPIPSTRDLVAFTSDPLRKVVPFVAPEVRVALPVRERIRVGMALAALIGFADVRPAIAQGVDEGTGPDHPTYNKNPIGLIGARVSESAVGTFVLAQISIFAQITF